MRLGAIYIALIFCWGCGDKPTLNFIPELDISGAKSFAAPSLSRYGSCESLKNDLRKSVLAEMKTRLAIQLQNMPSDRRKSAESQDTSSSAPMPAPGAAGGVKLVEGVDFSGTNNQEKGIDESDIVKVDGKYFYILNKSMLEIVDMPKVGGLEAASVVNLTTPGSGLLIVDDTAIVFANETSYKVNRTRPMPPSSPLIANYDGSNLRIDIIDLSPDRRSPQVKGSNYFQGEFLAARKIGNKIHVATYLDAKIPNIALYPELDGSYYLQGPAEQNRMWAEGISKVLKRNENAINNFDFLSLLPTKLTSAGGQQERVPVTEHDCAQTMSSEANSSTGFLSLYTIDLQNDQPKIDATHIRGNRPIVYASNNQFILASSEHQPWWFFGNENLTDKTTIHRFDLSDSSSPIYVDSAQVPGTLHNSFSLSEHEGYLRVATTTRPQNRFWTPRAAPVRENDQDENHLFILGDDSGHLDIVSSIEGLARGEKIWSARFSKDKGFLVTFKQVDPLFTLDLHDPKNPVVAGMLKIPGVSTYLQDIGKNHLLAVGYGGDEEGLDFQTTVSLFDVSDFSKPKLADSLSLAIQDNLHHSWSRASSEANENHLAINYFSPVAMTAIPMNTDRYVENPLDPSGGSFEYMSKLKLVNTEVGKDLNIHGEIDHSQFYRQESSIERRVPEIRRSYFVGDYIYAISRNAITSTRLTDMKTTGAYELR